MRRILELGLLDLIGQAEIRSDWVWASWWRERWLGLAQCPDAVLPGYARELCQVIEAGMKEYAQ